MSALNVSVPENSVVENPSHTLFGKEQKHRTFADLISEYLTLSLKISHNGSNNSSSVPLNSLAADYLSRDSEAISAYLDQKVAGRFSYRLEAYWQPVEAFPMESELIIGKKPPANAIRQSAMLSMPLYTSVPSRDTLLACVNDSVLEASLNSSDEEASKALFQFFNASLDVAAREGANEVVGLLFPSNYSGSVFGGEADESFHTLFSGVSETSDEKTSPSTEKMFNAYFSDTLTSGFRLDSKMYHGNSSTVGLSFLKEQLAGHIKDEIRKKLESMFSGEINRTVYSISETQNLSEAQAFRDSFIESIYRQINPGGARVILSLWNPAS
jgi:hypothetical protein